MLCPLPLPRFTLALGLCIGLSTFAGGRFQEGGPSEGELVAEHLRTLRGGRAALEERERAVAALLELGVEGPAQLAGVLERELRGAATRLERELPRFVTTVERAAEHLMKRRLDRRALAEIEELRALLREAAGDGALTKERVESECDPALARLEALWTVTPNQVWDAEEALYGELLGLLDRIDDQGRSFEWWELAGERLAASAEGAARLARLRRPADPRDRERQLLDELERVTRAATPIERRDEKVLEANRALAAGLDPEEALGIEALNVLRMRAGLAVLRIDPQLCAAARDHSKDMHELGFFAHDSPVAGKETPWKRAARLGTSASAENIAAGQSTGEGAIRAWWYSPGHHANMMGAHARIGLGRHEGHWTQLFGG